MTITNKLIASAAIIGIFGAAYVAGDTKIVNSEKKPLEEIVSTNPLADIAAVQKPLQALEFENKYLDEHDELIVQAWHTINNYRNKQIRKYDGKLVWDVKSAQTIELESLPPCNTTLFKTMLAMKSQGNKVQYAGDPGNMKQDISPLDIMQAYVLSTDPADNKTKEVIALFVDPNELLATSKKTIDPQTSIALAMSWMYINRAVADTVAVEYTIQKTHTTLASKHILTLAKEVGTTTFTINRMNAVPESGMYYQGESFNYVPAEKHQEVITWLYDKDVVSEEVYVEAQRLFGL